MAKLPNQGMLTPITARGKLINPITGDMRSFKVEPLKPKSHYDIEIAKQKAKAKVEPKTKTKDAPTKKKAKKK